MARRWVLTVPPVLLLLDLSQAGGPIGFVAADSPAPPGLRLGDVATPRRQAIELDLAPDREAFSGTTRIDVELRQPTSIIWLNARDLRLTDVKAESHGSSRRARVLPGGRDHVGLAFDGPLAGSAELTIRFEGTASARDLSGLFRQEKAGDWYLLSQFEPIAARRAFPCFDEPGFKIPWTLSLRIPEALVAFSNAPEASTTRHADGTRTMTFAETRPMPSYLVALAVGRFEIVDAGRAGRNGTPMRVIVPRGHGGEAGWLITASSALLPRLEDYFGTAYPYAKLDQLVVPLNSVAMEHPGLITYPLTWVLRRPELESASFRRQLAWLSAHEMAHMWFGNLVTLAWWNDVWLNEAFADWISTKVGEEWKPELGGRLGDVLATDRAMNDDGLATARRVRQPIASIDDIENAFDSLTYSKGEAILNMLEAWIGQQAFREGVHLYMSRHAWANASTSDFFNALGSSAGVDASGVASTFLDQAGVPTVSVEARCGPEASIVLSQERYLPIGSRDREPRTWRIPVCFVDGAGRRCELLTTPTSTLPLRALAPDCPVQLQLKADALGYYRVRYAAGVAPPGLGPAGPLDAGARISLLQDLTALAVSGHVPAGAVLAGLQAFAEDPNPYVALAAAAALERVTPGDVVPASMRPRLARFIRSTFGASARRMGWTPASDEGDEARMRRAMIVGLVAIEGRDPDLGRQAVALARRWLVEPTAVDADVLGRVLTAAAVHGDRSLLDAFREAVKKEEDPLRRRNMLVLLGSFRDPALFQEALPLALDPDLDLRETLQYFLGDDAATRELAWEFLRSNADTIYARLPEEWRGYMPAIWGAFCDADSRSAVEAFFKPRLADAPGAPRNLAQALETIELCSAYKEAQQPSLSEFLRRYDGSAP